GVIEGGSKDPPLRKIGHVEAGLQARLRSRNDAKDLVVACHGAAAPVAIVRAEVEITVRAADDVTKAAVGAIEQSFLRDDPTCVDDRARQVCAAQRSDEEIVRELWYQLPAIERDTG